MAYIKLSCWILLDLKCITVVNWVVSSCDKCNNKILALANIIHICALLFLQTDATSSEKRTVSIVASQQVDTVASTSTATDEQPTSAVSGDKTVDVTSSTCASESRDTCDQLPTDDACPGSAAEDPPSPSAAFREATATLSHDATEAPETTAEKSEATSNDAQDDVTLKQEQLDASYDKYSSKVSGLISVILQDTCMYCTLNDVYCTGAFASSYHCLVYCFQGDEKTRVSRVGASSSGGLTKPQKQIRKKRVSNDDGDDGTPADDPDNPSDMEEGEIQVLLRTIFVSSPI